MTVSNPMTTPRQNGDEPAWISDAMVGVMREANFSKDTITLEMRQPYYCAAAEFVVIRKSAYDALLSALSESK